jgi:hypothetical protein
VIQSRPPVKQEAAVRTTLKLWVYILLATLGVSACNDGCRKSADEFTDQFAATFGQVVTAPASDSTPPTVTLTIPDQGSGQIVLGSSSAPVQVPMGRNGFFVVAAAEDPEGIKEVGFVGESRLQCRNEKEGIGQIQTATLLGPTDTDNTGTGGQALTRRWLPRFVDDTYLQCGTGWTRVSASVTLRALGRNFSGPEVISAAATFVW